MLELAAPWLLLLLPLPLLSWYLLPPCRRSVPALRVPFFTLITQAAGATPGSGSVVIPHHPADAATLSLCWALLLLGLAKPQWIGEPITRTEAARDIMLAIDLSASMDYKDLTDQQGVTRRRLDSVKAVVDDFVAQRETDRIGLIVFGDRAYLQLPFSRDLRTARQMVALTEVNFAGPRTALGDAIGLAINAFQRSQTKERLLILLTDGNDTASTMTPLNAAAIAASQGVQLFTIGVGDPDASGEDRVDFTTLQQIATRTGGAFFRAENGAELAQIYRQIDEMTPVDLKVQRWHPRTSLAYLPTALFLLILFLWLLLKARRHASA